MLDYGFYNMDCMDGMKQFPDKFFDLAIVDPPYGGAGGDVDDVFNGALTGRFGGVFQKYFGEDKRGHAGGGHMKKYNYANWDIAPPKEYFEELFRISKNQIIWGGQLLRIAANKMLRYLAQKQCPGKVHNVNGGICLDVIQCECKSI